MSEHFRVELLPDVDQREIKRWRCPWCLVKLVDLGEVDQCPECLDILREIPDGLRGLG